MAGLALTLALIPFAPSARSAEPPADLVVWNAKIVTVNPQSAIVEAAAIREGRFVAVGANAEIKKWIGKKTRVIDARGKTVVPGLIESHVHAIGVARDEAVLPFVQLGSIAEIQQWVRQRAATVLADEWIEIPRVDLTRLREGRLPTRAELDAAAAGHPVVFNWQYGSRQIQVLTTAALQAAKITRDTPEPAGGKTRILKDAQGELTGVLENPGNLTSKFKPSKPVSDQALLAALQEVQRSYNRIGITSITERNSNVEGYRTYEKLKDAGELTVRVTVTIGFGSHNTLEEAEEAIRALPFRFGDGDDWVRVGPLKIFVDGGILYGTAYMREPYGPEANQFYGFTDPDHRGTVNFTPDRIEAMMRAAYRSGWQMCSHVTGDAGVDLILDALERVNRDMPVQDRRYTLIHAYFPNVTAVSRAASLGVCVDTQPAWYYKDGDALAKALGEERLKHFIGLSDWRRGGLKVAINSDHMLGLDPNKSLNPFNPFLAMYVAVTRRTELGRVIGPEQRVSREQALRMATIDAAYLSFDEQRKGSIEVGKLGDLVLLSDDLLTCDAERIKDIQAVATVVGGKVVHDVSISSNAPFSIQHQDNTAWLVRPNGERFFSLGVCVVSQGASRAEFDPANPGYAAWQHYADSNAWAQATLARLKTWGFTTVGGWSDFQALKRSAEQKVAFAPVLHIGSTAGAPWWDMWDPKIIGRMDSVAREQILALRDDPRVLGYYSDNEMGWWNAILFKMTMEQASTSGQRQRLMELLRQTYQNDWAALLRDFEPAPDVENWDTLSRHGLLFLRPGGQGIRVQRRFLELLADRYYSLVHDMIRKYDPRALILGERYQSFYYPEVAQACARHVDAVSSNLNASWSDGTFARFYVETLHRLAGKPVLIGEFYMCARDNRSGNKNSRGVYPVVSTQKERAVGFRTTLEALLKIPYVIGADWFQYYDEPTHGRYDGENFNFGLVDIHDRPYETLTATALSLDLAGLKTQPARVRPDARQGVPPAPRNPTAQFQPNLALKDWDRERGFIPAASEFPLADLYICWNSKAIYLGLYAQDVTEDTFYKDKIVRTSDRAEWIVAVGESAHPIRTRLGAGLEPIIDDPTVRVVNLSGLNGNYRNIACLELPAKAFGQKRFKTGDTVKLSSTFLGHCRGYQVEWKGTFTLDGKGRTH